MGGRGLVGSVKAVGGSITVYKRVRGLHKGSKERLEVLRRV